jgi:DNA-binding transcriptional MocR family regulator
MNASPEQLSLVPDEPTRERFNFDEWRRAQAAAAQHVGQDRARHADPEGSAAVLREIKRLAATGQEFSADDVRGSKVTVSSPSVIGAAFRMASRHGWIVPTGSITIARSASRRGGIQRTWRGA